MRFVWENIYKYFRNLIEEYSREFIEKVVGQDIFEEAFTHIQSASQLHVFRVVKHL